MPLSPLLSAAHAGQWPPTLAAFQAHTRLRPPKSWGGETWAQGILRWGMSRFGTRPLDPDAPMWTWLDKLIAADAGTPAAEETARLLLMGSLLVRGRLGWDERVHHWQATAETWLGGPAAAVDHLLTTYADLSPTGTRLCPIFSTQLSAGMFDRYRAEDADLWQGVRANGQARLWAWWRLRDIFSQGRGASGSPHAGAWGIPDLPFAVHARALLARADPWRDTGAINLALAHPPTQPTADLWQALALEPAGMATWDMAQPLPDPRMLAEVYRPYAQALQDAHRAKQRSLALAQRPASPAPVRIRHRA